MASLASGDNEAGEAVRRTTRHVSAEPLSRRDFVHRAARTIATVTAAAALTTTTTTTRTAEDASADAAPVPQERRFPRRALAAESGDAQSLPAGVREFNALLVARRQWDDIAKAVRDRHDVMSAEEWSNIRGYLRKLYQNAAAMETLSRSFDDKRGAKKAAMQVYREFCREVRALDKPAEARDWRAFLDGHARSVDKLSEFFDILQSASGVPDEL